MIEKANHSILRSHHSRESHDRLIHNRRLCEMNSQRSGHDHTSHYDLQKSQAEQQCRDIYNATCGYVESKLSQDIIHQKR